MPNPLFNQFNNNLPNNPIAEFMNEFRALQQTVKNPKQEVERLMQSGQMSQQDFNKLSQMANQLMTKFK